MQIVAEVLRHPDDKTQMSLIFACREMNHQPRHIASLYHDFWGWSNEF